MNIKNIIPIEKLLSNSEYPPGSRFPGSEGFLVSFKIFILN